MAFWVYVLRCADDSYYTGHTEDLDRRIAEHESGTVPGYTHDRRPVTLMYSEAFATREEALAAETRIKPWSRAKKEALIRGDWASLRIAALPPEERAARAPRLSSGRTEGGTDASGLAPGARRTGAGEQRANRAGADR